MLESGSRANAQILGGGFRDYQFNLISRIAGAMNLSRYNRSCSDFIVHTHEDYRSLLHEYYERKNDHVSAHVVQPAKSNLQIYKFVPLGWERRAFPLYRKDGQYAHHDSNTDPRYRSPYRNVSEHKHMLNLVGIAHINHPILFNHFYKSRLNSVRNEADPNEAPANFQDVTITSLMNFYDNLKIHAIKLNYANFPLLFNKGKQDMNARDNTSTERTSQEKIKDLVGAHTADFFAPIPAHQEKHEDFFNVPFNRAAFLRAMSTGESIITADVLTRYMSTPEEAEASINIIQGIADRHGMLVSYRRSELGNTHTFGGKPDMAVGIAAALRDAQTGQMLMYILTDYSRDQTTNWYYSYDPGLAAGIEFDAWVKSNIRHHTVSITRIDVIGDRVDMTTTEAADLDLSIRDEFYPFIEEGVDNLWTSFMESRVNVMTFVGVWGSGKTTLSRQAARYAKGNVYMVDNPDVYQNPDKFAMIAKIIADQKVPSILILEEADAAIEGQKKTAVLSRILSMTDGIITTRNKLVINSNLATSAQINDAVSRHGRCFRSIDFRELTPEEANAARASLGREPREFDKNVILSVALNSTKEEKVKSYSNSKFGFMSK